MPVAGASARAPACTHRTSRCRGGASGGEIGSHYSTVAYFTTVRLAWPLRRGTPMVRLTKGRPGTPCCRATRPKNLGYGEIKGRGLGSRTQGRSGGGMLMSIRSHMLLAAGAVAGMLAFAPAHAQETVKIGLILPMTG